MKELMTKAHRIAKHIKIRTKDYSIALSFALKLVWADLTKEWNFRQIAEYFEASLETYNQAVAPTKVVNNDETDYSKAIIPSWLIMKNLTQHERSAVNEAYNQVAKVITAKAVLFQFDTPYGNVEMWAPKSVLGGI